MPVAQARSWVSCCGWPRTRLLWRAGNSLQVTRLKLDNIHWVNVSMYGPNRHSSLQLTNNDLPNKLGATSNGSTAIRGPRRHSYSHCRTSRDVRIGQRQMGAAAGGRACVLPQARDGHAAAEGRCCVAVDLPEGALCLVSSKTRKKKVKTKRAAGPKANRSRRAAQSSVEAEATPMVFPSIPCETIGEIVGPTMTDVMDAEEVRLSQH